jgi:hypothetical protein
MAKFRQLQDKFWIDPRVHDLTPTQKLLFAYAITGPSACRAVHTSGIYELTRGAMQMHTNIDIAEIEEALKFFNQKRPMLLEYDEEKHMVFVKSFFKYNTSFKSAVQNLFEDYKMTGKKSLKFWLEFSEIYHDKLIKLLLTQTKGDEAADFLDKLINLKDQPLTDFKPTATSNLENCKKSLQI